MQRITVLTSFFTQRLLRSVTGVLMVLLTLSYWFIFFNPTQDTPDSSYYMLIIAVFGLLAAFLSTLAIASKANQAELFPWLVRLPSRIEYMTAVLLSSVLVAFLLQLLLALLALFRGPTLGLTAWLIVPPIWISLVVLATVLALHATDLVTSGWSRVIVFGILAILLFAQSIRNATLNNMLNNLNRVVAGQGWTALSDSLATYASELSTSDSNFLGALFGLVFWPFRAILEGITSGSFSTAQALAPAILLLYATILFMLAADLFANKDLTFTE